MMEIVLLQERSKRETKWILIHFDTGSFIHLPDLKKSQLRGERNPPDHFVRGLTPHPIETISSSTFLGPQCFINSM